MGMALINMPDIFRCEMEGGSNFITNVALVRTKPSFSWPSCALPHQGIFFSAWLISKLGAGMRKKLLVVMEHKEVRRASISTEGDLNPSPVF